MKRVILVLSLTVSTLLMYAHIDNDLTANFTRGSLSLSSISSITFGPEGILFIGDPMNATIYALDTEDKVAKASNEEVSVKNLDKKIAALLGASIEDIIIHDMAVSPISQNIYFSVGRNDTPVLLRLVSGNLEIVSLDDASFSMISLNNPVSADAEQRGRKLRPLAITDLAYSNGVVYVAGLSNEEFASAFRSIPFPFKEDQQFATLEIWHASHGRYETQAPIRTFLPIELEGQSQILASYTCTPLVTFPVDQLKDGQHVKGKTVAELGNRNNPLDIISYNKNGKPYILIANSKRALMRITPEDIIAQKIGLTEPLAESHGTDGIEYLSIAEVYIQQIDNLNDESVVVIQRLGNGDLDLRSIKTSRL